MFSPPPRDAQMIMEDIKKAVSELEQESSIPPVGVELVDNELATLYMNSKKSEVHSGYIYVLLKFSTPRHTQGAVGLVPARAAHSLCALGLCFPPRAAHSMHINQKQDFWLQLAYHERSE